MFSKAVSSVVAEIRRTHSQLDELDIGAYMQFEFQNRAPVMLDFFNSVAKNVHAAEDDIMCAMTTYSPGSSLVPLMAFMGVKVTGPRLNYMRVMCHLTPTDIRYVLKYRPGDPEILKDATLKDVMAFATQLDRMVSDGAKRHRVNRVLSKYDVMRVLTIEPSVPKHVFVDTLRMCIVCLKHVATVDPLSAPIVTRYKHAFNARLRSL